MADLTGFVVFVLLIFSLNTWLAITTLLSVMNGVIRINGKELRRETQPYGFWIYIVTKAVLAVGSFLYLVSVFETVLKY